MARIVHARFEFTDEIGETGVATALSPTNAHQTFMMAGELLTAAIAFCEEDAADGVDRAAYLIALRKAAAVLDECRKSINHAIKITPV